MQLVLYPHEVEKPDGGPWIKRLKYTTVAELLSDYEQSNAAIGRTHCPVADYFRQHLGDPLGDVEAYVYAHPVWGPFALCETAYKTFAFNNSTSHPHGEFIAAWVQHFVLRELVKHDFNDARHAFSEMLKEPTLRFVSPEAQQLALDYLVQNHPNPRKFLEKPEVLSKFPGLDPSAYPAPDFD